jgi:alpha-amylase
VKKLEPLVKETNDRDFLKTWRYFQTSDHLYYMFTAGGAPGEVHSYFSPFDSPIDAFVTAEAAILDFENRLRLASVAANEPFLFYTGVGEKFFTKKMAWSLKGFPTTVQKVSLESLEFHNSRGDFEKWAEKSLHDRILSAQFKGIRLADLKGKQLRKSLAEVAEQRFDELHRQMQKATQCF